MELLYFLFLNGSVTLLGCKPSFIPIDLSACAGSCCSRCLDVEVGGCFQMLRFANNVDLESLKACQQVSLGCRLYTHMRLGRLVRFHTVKSTHTTVVWDPK